MTQLTSNKKAKNMVNETRTAFLELVDSGVLDSRDVLENLLVNYLNKDEAEDFIMSEYQDYFDESESTDESTEDLDEEDCF